MPRRRLPLLLLPLLLAETAQAFCGFYVASGGAKLYNHTSQVVLVRDGDRTVMTICSDVLGDPDRFALVVPVPTTLRREQVHVGDSAWVARLDAFSAPRLVEYRDGDPCPRPLAEIPVDNLSQAIATRAGIVASSDGLHFRGGRAEVVHVLAHFDVDEYEISILSADEDRALVPWLQRHGYRVPSPATPIIDAYRKQGMKFFVARVNISKRKSSGWTTLRPLQIAYESPRFMLPVRLGLTNANGPQDLFVYALTRRGRVEPVNYRTAWLPSDQDLPSYVRDAFPAFQTAMFDRLVGREGMGIVYAEHFWDAGWCDPCAAPAPQAADLRGLGVWWRGSGDPVYVTRLHARYDRASFPEDLMLQVTADRQPRQTKYLLHREARTIGTCPEATEYLRALEARHAREAATLAALTGWSPTRIAARMAADSTARPRQVAWWDSLWDASR